MLDRQQLSYRIDEVMEQEAALFLERVPGASHLTDGQPLNEAYYIRHRIETIKRIRLTARTDAIALSRMVEEDYDAARPWARYVCEELEHDRLFLADLAAHGVSEAAVLATPLFTATRDMIGYLKDKIEEFGSIAAVAYSLFVEWNSIRYSLPAATKALVTFSADHVAGSLSHAGIDEEENHYDVMVDIAHRLLQYQKTEEILIQLVRDISELFRRYFDELYHLAFEHTAAA
jgi:hypothetical protein